MKMVKGEKGSIIQEEYELKAERAKFLYCEEILVNGKVTQAQPEKPVTITAWNYFGIAACNFIHPGVEECDGLMTIITPNEVEGMVVAFPDWEKDEFFNTTGFLVFNECDSSFDIADKDAVSLQEKLVNENIVPILSNHTYIESIEPEFIMKANSIFKAFDKYWSSTLFIAKTFEKQFEKKLNKKNMERDFLNRRSIDEIITQH